MVSGNRNALQTHVLWAIVAISVCFTVLWFFGIRPFRRPDQTDATELLDEPDDSWVAPEPIRPIDAEPLIELPKTNEAEEILL